MSISVIIPAFQARAYVRRAVLSALAQPEVTEVLVVEDGSTDGTLAECEAAARLPKVRLLRHPGGCNRGASESRNLGLMSAGGAAVAFLDADDEYLSGRFAIASEILRDPGTDGVHEPVELAFESEGARQRYESVRGPQQRLELRRGIPPEHLFAALLGGNAGFCSLDGLLLRKAFAQALGGFHPDLRLHQDSHFLLRAVAMGRLRPGASAPVARAWIHGSNRITGATDAVSRPLRRLLYQDLMRWGLDRGLPPRFVFPVFRKYLHQHAAPGQGKFRRWANYAGAVLSHPKDPMRLAWRCLTTEAG